MQVHRDIIDEGSYVQDMIELDENTPRCEEWEAAAYPSDFAHLLDPVAIIRAANGELPTYEALTKHERSGMWDWLIGQGGRELATAVAHRLGLTDGDRKKAIEASAVRVRRGRPIDFQPGVWGTLLPFSPPELPNDWEEFYGRPMTRGGLGGYMLPFPASEYDPPRRFNTDKGNAA